MNTHDPNAPRNPGRRKFLALGVGAFVVSAAPIAAFRARSRPLVTRRTVPVMGTLAELAVVHDDPAAAHAALDAAVAELRAVERSMTRFSRHSEIGRANEGAFRAPVLVGAATAAVLAEGLRWAEASNGAFDPCLGGAVELWDVAHRAAPPAAGEVRRYAGAGLYRQLELDPIAGGARVVFRAPEIGLDLGGIAKGYGVDRAVAALRELGITGALVNVGGDLHALGRSAEGDPWEIGVRSPDDPHRLAARFHLADRAVATSGDYEQYFNHDGRRYHHLLDGVTGEPRRTAARSITIAADCCMTADAAGTAAFGMPADAAGSLLARVAPGSEILHMG
jgi:FAD:protein FMN transferase